MMPFALGEAMPERKRECWCGSNVPDGADPVLACVHFDGKWIMCAPHLGRPGVWVVAWGVNPQRKTETFVRYDSESAALADFRLAEEDLA